MNCSESKNHILAAVAAALTCFGLFLAPVIGASMDKSQSSSEVAHNQNESLVMRVIQMERAQNESGMGIQRGNWLRRQPAE